MLTDVEIEPLHKARVALPAQGGEHVMNRLQRAADHPIAHSHEAPPADGFDDLRIEPLWPRHPPQCGQRAGELTSLRLSPRPEMAQDSEEVILVAIGQQQGHTGRRQLLGHLMHHALRHGQRTLADIDRQPQLALRIDARLYPMAGACKALDGVVRTAFTVIYVTQYGVQLVQWHLVHVYVAEKGLGKGLELLGGFHQPSQHGIWIDLKDPGGGANASALRYACQDADPLLHGDLLPMQDRAMRLGKVALARGAVVLSPGAATGMAVGTEMAQSALAALATARMGTEVC
jgi:hypothetical protein